MSSSYNFVCLRNLGLFLKGRPAPRREMVPDTVSLRIRQHGQGHGYFTRSFHPINFLYVRVCNCSSGFQPGRSQDKKVRVIGIRFGCGTSTG